MTPASKLGVYVLCLAAIFGAGVGVGAVLGPEPSDEPSPVTVVEHPPGHDGAHS